MLLNELGVGETVVVEDLTYAMIDGLCLSSFGFVELDVCRLHNRVILSSDERYLFLVYVANEFHCFVTTALDTLNRRKPALANGTFCLLAAITTNEFQQYV